MEGKQMQEEIKTEKAPEAAGEAVSSAGAAQAKEPEAIIGRARKYFKLSNLIYIMGIIQMAAGAVFGIVLFFVNMAGFRGYGYNYYYSMPRFSSFFSSVVIGLAVFLAFLASGVMTMGFGKIVQAAEVYIQRRAKK